VFLSTKNNEIIFSLPISYKLTLDSKNVKKNLGYIVLLLPISLLSALVAVQTFASSQELVVDARVPALAAATVALRFKAPFILVVLISAVTAAALRYFELAI
jgi:hypothetical protein